jgi:hypothetical protein
MEQFMVQLCHTMCHRLLNVCKAKIAIGLYDAFLCQQQQQCWHIGRTHYENEYDNYIDKYIINF